ncbi:hypothetical protein R5R40_08670 [Oenococcus oeni]|uniref:hypothetical protein n=1 Tax=Oenococcus oeni TaxID=1247 RepID=UPI00050F6F80|nr:hypothetical protein [Oenococcus oeni]KGH73702.1 hypothetical protein X280_01885 [Oenococcus oeni IOEB_0502]
MTDIEKDINFFNARINEFEQHVKKAKFYYEQIKIAQKNRANLNKLYPETMQPETKSPAELSLRIGNFETPTNILNISLRDLSDKEEKDIDDLLKWKIVYLKHCGDKEFELAKKLVTAKPI